MSNLTDSLESESEFAWYDRLCGQLLRVQGEFERFANGETHLYHVLFEFEGPLDDSQWEAFVAANRGAVGGGKAEHWECLPDRSLGGCFYGDDLSTLDEFRRIASSGYLILREIQFLATGGRKLPENCVLSLPGYADDTAWLRLIHQTARLNTAFLRHQATIWKLSPGTLLDEVPEERLWESGPNDIRFPSHPISLSLHLDVFASSSEAINCWVYPQDVVSVGGLFDHSPIVLPTVDLEDDATSEPETTAARKETFSVEISNVECPKLSWDGRDLVVMGQLVKRYRNKAENQKKLLSAFQNAGWPSLIEDPFEIQKEETKALVAGISKTNSEFWKSMRRQTIDDFNSLLLPIVFVPSGDGYGVAWDWRTSKVSEDK